MSDPYRAIAVVPTREVASWKIHEFASHASVGGNEACRWCGQARTIKRTTRCFGRKRFWLFGKLTCPATPHHHVICWNGLRGCHRDWLEETCDDARVIDELITALEAHGTLVEAVGGSLVKAIATGNTPADELRKRVNR